MLPKYLATLAIAVVVATFAASSLKFATRSQVISGEAVDETLNFEFVLEADGTHTYRITPTIAQFLETHIGFHTDGPAALLRPK
jgi:ABC-type phosphate/phosphonate transport system substrate-binding protein